MQTAVAYDFKGGLLAAERQLAVDVTQTLDWLALGELEDVSGLEQAAASMLESEVFRTEATFDALGRAVTQTTPDGTVVELAYNEAGLLEGVTANVRGSASSTTGDSTKAQALAYIGKCAEVSFGIPTKNKLGQPGGYVVFNKFLGREPQHVHWARVRPDGAQFFYEPQKTRKVTACEVGQFEAFRITPRAP